MIRKLLRNLSDLLGIYLSRRIWTCFAELWRVMAAPRLVRTCSACTWTTSLPTNDHPHNGSIVRFEGRWIVAVRTANVHVSRFLRRLEIEGGPSCVDSRTWLVELDDGFRVKHRLLLPDKEFRSSESLAKNGLTDPRLFVWNSQLWAIWSAERVIGDDWKNITNTMCIGRIDDGKIAQFRFLTSPNGSPREKNWMPWPVGSQLRLVYSPATLETYELFGEKLSLLHKALAADSRLRGYSGSSQVQPWGEDWIFVVHYAARTIRLASAQLFPTFYLHRFVVVSTDFTLKQISREVFLEHKGTEFCAGLAVTKGKVVPVLRTRRHSIPHLGNAPKRRRKLANGNMTTAFMAACLLSRHSPWNDGKMMA